MDNNAHSENQKQKIFNSIHMPKNHKPKYFKIEKTTRYRQNRGISLSLTSNDKESKKIFRTEKDYHLINRKILREQNFSISDKQNELKLPRKQESHKLTKVENSESNKIIDLNENDNKSIDVEESKNNENDVVKCFKIKLMLIYLYSIKNLCKYINRNLFNAKNEAFDGFLYQIYQSLQILDKKINDFKFFRSSKDKLLISKDDLQDIFSLKNNLLSMKKLLNDNMSQNLINIYVDIDNFCKEYSV